MRLLQTLLSTADCKFLGKMKLQAAALLILLLVNGSTIAAGISDEPFETMVREADLVVVAHVTSSEKLNDIERDSKSFVTVEVDLVLKGDAPRRIRIANLTEVPEIAVRCCNQNRLYLLLLKKISVGAYMSANARFGVLLLPTLDGPRAR